MTINMPDYGDGLGLNPNNPPYPINVSPINPYDDTAASESEASGGTGDEEIPMVNAAGLKFRFNPPLHVSARFLRADLGTGRDNWDKTQASIDREVAMTYWSGAARPREGKDLSLFEGLRLGRIVQGDMAISAAMLEANERYGMRFLYNPSELSGSMNVGTDFIPSQQSAGAFVLQQGLERMNLEILVNRIPDIQGRAKRDEYGPTPISKYDRDQIQERGTHYDIDFLYRCANGLHNLNSRKNTGDIGLLLPNPCNLILGRTTTRGALTSVQVDDQLFSQDMVPMLSYVRIEFTRFLSTTEEETNRLESSGIQRQDSVADTSADETEDPKPSRGALNGSQVYSLAKAAGFTATQADTMTQIAYKESGWNPSSLNDNSRTGDLSYGLWQINMIGNLGPERRKQFGISKNSDLYDPATNARAARKVFLSQGFAAWSVYKNNSYRTVKKTWR